MWWRKKTPLGGLAQQTTPHFWHMLFVIIDTTIILTAHLGHSDTLNSQLEKSKPNMYVFSKKIEKNDIIIYNESNKISDPTSCVAVICCSDPSSVLYFTSTWFNCSVGPQALNYGDEKKWRISKQGHHRLNHKSTHQLSGSHSDTGFNSPHPHLVIIIRCPPN